MPNIGSVLKEEIARISRKTVKSEIEPLRKHVLKQRAAIAELKRQLVEAQRDAKASRKEASRASSNVESSFDSGPKVRFSPNTVKALRAKLGLSAERLGKLIQVSGQTIYNWEAGSSRPRQAQLERIAEVRGWGKRKATAMLDTAP